MLKNTHNSRTIRPILDSLAAHTRRPLGARRRAFVLASPRVAPAATGRTGRGPDVANAVLSTAVASRRRKLLPSAMAIATVLIIVATAAMLAACTSTTRAAGPAADATHETRVERPGNTATRRIEIRVRPSDGAAERRGDGGEGDAPAERGSASGRGGAGVSGAPAPLGALLVAAALGTGGQAAGGTGDLDAVLRAAARLAESGGVEVEIVVDEYEHAPLTADTSRSTLDESPATLATRSGEAALGFTTRLRRFPLPWGGEARGGGFGFEADLVGGLLGGRGVNVLHLIGAAVMALAVIPLLRTPRRWGSAAVFGLTGLAIAMTGTLVDEYPWVTLPAALTLVALLAYGAYEAWRRGRMTAALDAITPVVERAGNAGDLKARIGERAGRMLAAVKAETTASKARAGN